VSSPCGLPTGIPPPEGRALSADTARRCCHYGDYSSAPPLHPGEPPWSPSPWQRTHEAVPAHWPRPVAYTGEGERLGPTRARLSQVFFPAVPRRERNLDWGRPPHPPGSSEVQSSSESEGDFDPDSVQLPKYLRCYRCLLETKELGCLLGSDICLAPPGSSCMTLLIKNNSGSDIMVSDCRRKEQMSDCSYTRSSPVFGFWIFSRCCFREFCNNPQNRVFYIP
ncbi:lymphocyte antigen 6 complex locus protein G5c, partial [Mustela erminea]|uniref:lymphocyte antigen 6 complex locus protein G5c n=1 Tax=Mustela erminea TaxID=36723 RepID=UPI0013870172